MNDIENDLAAINRQLIHLRQCLPYADHGAYWQDLRKIEQLEQERRELEEIKHKMTVEDKGEL
jgi:hypothetical protein